MKTAIKFCGITRLEDALFAVQLGVDAIGFVFYNKSPRVVSLDETKHIVSQLPPFITKVGLFVNAAAAYINSVAALLDVLQFHGDETDSFCCSFNKPFIKALRVKTGDNITQMIKCYPHASAILLDTYHQDAYGGTGQIFDWTIIPKLLPKPIILAGGLTAENVTAAIATTRPYAVDVSSGIEISPGIKDPAKMKSFIRFVRLADET